VLGRRVLTLADGERAAGFHDLRLDVAGLPSGPYLVRVTAGDEAAVVRLVVAR
jgi:hypothetical protein